MKFERIYKNIIGLSCPIFGLQWNAQPIEIDEAKNIILFLENKRVLFNPASMEDIAHCSQSVIQIRSELTRVLQKLSSDSNLAKSVKNMRRACQGFSDKLGHPQFSQFERPVQVSMLERELFKLREKCGVSIAEIAVAYGIDVDDGLAGIIPFNNTESI
ncbi:hypothetical protein H4F51_13245 [Pectobacterium brasiliense]|uniref:DUF6650 family protein n=1 Tax=Pectobacterium brasiliense TaxID=180957 RepID=UPI0015DE9E19|nr:DUF6650 family protein [Pectobacterium brasiliense]MBA0197656.1 hypothetical protein [Pectobacterium brasiliense]MBN3093527.1 hypothetical protein [Pectobacterium brasiliense]MBN3140880.1 hypothetical protein [Pectobacterium brasiliense]MBW5896631.1 hypothetical protein [Pectobacterium brasiliense]